MKNPGIIFQDRLYKVLARKGLYWEKFRDYAGIGYSEDIRFTPTNPYDVFFFYDKFLFCIELKSTNKNSFSIGIKRMIKPHQVKGLYRAASASPYICAGFLFEFREDDKVYFMKVSDFIDVTSNNTKKSIHRREIEAHAVLVAWNQHTFTKIPDALLESHEYIFRLYKK